ncbi:hypothetical protein [Halomonas sp. BM-2019]|uniref:hypothetical protein n=1 Tax=Halomonas sp. BM-2019 TaxID=2811227 RepID=UPI001B3C2D0E|nr:MAG: hypothetical protein J5F18_09755 [Halomonas sp. BM-2019]
MNTALRPDDVLIRRLRVRGGPGDGERLRAALGRASGCGTADNAWVFIRTLRVRGACGELAAQVLSGARARSGAATDPDVVRFANLDVLLAALLHDLCAGCAAECWYWRRWASLFALPRGRAIAQLLVEHAERLGAVTAQLARRGRLAQVWLMAELSAMRTLSDCLAARSAGRLATPSESQSLAQSPDTILATLPRPLYHRWRSVLARLPREDPRRRCALQLIAVEHAPLALMRAPQALLQALDAQFPVAFEGTDEPLATPDAMASDRRAGPSEETDIAVPSTPELRAEDGQVRSEGDADVLPGRAAAPTLRQDASGPPDAVREDMPHEGPFPPDRSAPPGAVRTAPPSVPDPDDRKVPSRPPLHTPGDPSDATAARQPDHRTPPGVTVTDLAGEDGEWLQTRQGGLLYLLNMLDRPAARELMEMHWQSLPSGWGWVYRLGGELGFGRADPLAGFIAAQLGLERAEDLDTLPPLPARSDLLGIARNWYGRSGLWTPELLSLDARLRATPSHIDLYAPLAAVRLEVRLAGLDVDPGWLPWLGRVVHFHYD